MTSAIGGLDHVLSMRRNVNVLVLDTEVYSNTGGQASKSTPLGAAAKFAALGKDVHKKDLGLMAMSYGHVYVASVAFGAKDSQTVTAFQEAASYPGPSLIIAYSHCIAHGYDLRFGAEQQKLAVSSGIWPLFRYDPERIEQGEPPLIIDSMPGTKFGRGVHAERGPIPDGRGDRPRALPPPGRRGPSAIRAPGLPLRAACPHHVSGREQDRAAAGRGRS